MNVKGEHVLLAAYAVAGVIGAVLVVRALKGFGQIPDALKRIPVALRLATTEPVTISTGNAVRLPGGRVVEVSDLQRDDAGFTIRFQGDDAIMTYHGQQYVLERRDGDGVINATFLRLQ